MKTRNLLLLSLFFVLAACSEKKSILGAWENDMGQTLIFHEDQTAEWIIPFDTEVDTFNIKYNVDYSTEPIQLDLYDFTKGPIVGLTLYGIIEFKENSFLCDFEAGKDASERPEDFNPEEAQTFVKK